MNKIWRVIGYIVLGCLLFGCNGLQPDQGQWKETEKPAVTEKQEEKKMEITPTLQPDPCGWRKREKPIITELQDRKRIAIAPKIGEKKFIFNHEVRSLGYDEEGIKNVRIEINLENYITFLQKHGKVKKIQEVQNYFTTNNRLSIEHDNVWEIIQENNLPNTNLRWDSMDEEWFFDMIEEGRAAIYESKSGLCVPYYDVKEWGYPCMGGRKFYLPNGTVFIITIDYIC